MGGCIRSRWSCWARPVSYTHLDVYKRQIPTNSQHPDEAWTFLRYMMRTENQLAHAAYGSVPMLKSEAASYTDGYMVQVVKSLDNSYAEGICPQTNALWAVNGEQLQPVSYTHLDVYKRQGVYASGGSSSNASGDPGGKKTAWMKRFTM